MAEPGLKPVYLNQAAQKLFLPPLLPPSKEQCGILDRGACRGLQGTVCLAWAGKEGPFVQVVLSSLATSCLIISTEPQVFLTAELFTPKVVK